MQSKLTMITKRSANANVGSNTVHRAPRGARRALHVMNIASPPTKQDAVVTTPTVPAPTPTTPAPGGLPPVPEPQWPPRRPFAAIALDKAIEGVGDVSRHLQRMAVPAPLQDDKHRLVDAGGGRLRLTAKKPVVLLLGTGWGAHSIIKVIDHEAYDVVVVSPRNHFIFTPMLPSTAVGTVEFRSLLDPIRTANPFVTYFEAACDKLDTAAKVATCTSSSAYDDGRRTTFEIPYDIAVVAVGEQPNTFGIKGVREYCFFMKEITDTVELRKKIGEKFELCELPGTSEEDRRRNLHFVVVGGGPTGVEFAGTLSDFVSQDLKKKYPDLMPYVKVTLLQSAQSILTQFDSTLAERAKRNLASTGVSVMTGVRVEEVTDKQVKLGDGRLLDYGVIVWSTGNAARPLVQDLVKQVPIQQAINGKAAAGPGCKLAVDPYMRVIGASNLVALGDCSMLHGNRLPTTAQVAAQQGSFVAHLINDGFHLGVGGFDQPPPRRPLTRPPVDLVSLVGGSALAKWLLTAAMGGKERIALASQVSTAVAELDTPAWARYPSNNASAVEGAAAAAGSGSGSQSAAGTPRSSSSSGSMDEMPSSPLLMEYYNHHFEFLSLGIMAYVGNDKALTQVEAFDASIGLYGSIAFLLWRSVYITKQVSFRNRVLILFDWMKTQVFGRDLSLF